MPKLKRLPVEKLPECGFGGKCAREDGDICPEEPRCPWRIPSHVPQDLEPVGFDHEDTTSVVQGTDYDS